MFRAVASNASSTGSTRAEWKAWETGSLWATMPRSASRSQSVRRAVSSPAITVWAGPFIAAMDRVSPSSPARASGGAATAAMPPPGGSDCISRPRRAISRSPSSRLKTPARQAATYSPTEWPITMAGRTPQAAHSSVRA